MVSQESRGGTHVKHTIKNLGGDSVILTSVFASLFLSSLRLSKQCKTFSQESRGDCDVKLIKNKSSRATSARHPVHEITSCIMRFVLQFLSSKK